jgi:ribonuclease R
LYRIHEKPSLDDISKLQDTLNLFWIKFIFQKNNTSEFSKLLGIIEKQDDNKKSFLEKMVLRTLTKAVYSKENFWHFGLWLSFYSHFTSPIRRYSDLQIHRIIKEKISKKLDKKRQIHYEEILKNVAHHISDNERKAERLEYKIRDYFTCIFYKDKIWQVFNANISSVLKKWIFVSLEDTTEWFIELKNTNFLDELQEHIDLSTGKKYRLADNIKVKLIEVDQELLRLNFEFTN